MTHHSTESHAGQELRGAVSRWSRAIRVAAVCGVLLTFAGCHVVGQGGPVARNVITCRQLAQRGVQAMERGDFEQAEQLLAEAIEANAVDVDARRHYSEVLWRRGTQAEALDQIQQAIALAGGDADLHLRHASMQLTTGQVEQARQSVDRAIALDPHAASALALSGDILSAVGRADEALAAYHRSLSLEPRQPEVLLRLAELYRQQNQPQRALANLQALQEFHAVGEAPPNVLYLEGLAYLAMGRFEEAAASFAEFNARSDPTPESLVALADAYWRAGRIDQAGQAARRALTLAPSHPTAVALLQGVEATQRPGVVRR